MKKKSKDFLETYDKIRKPMPPPTKIIPHEEEDKWDWRKRDEEDGDEYQGYIDQFTKD